MKGGILLEINNAGAGPLSPDKCKDVGYYWKYIVVRVRVGRLAVCFQVMPQVVYNNSKEPLRAFFFSFSIFDDYLRFFCFALFFSSRSYTIFSIYQVCCSGRKHALR